MGLKDLKSDLSKFRKEFKPAPVVNQEKGRTIKPFNTTPLSEKSVPDIVNKQSAITKKGIDINKSTQPAGRHTKGVDVDNASSVSGRHTEGTDVRNTVPLSGRHTTGKDVENTVPLSGRHTEGADVRNTVAISGRHTEGTDVRNTVAISGRHTKGTDVDNNSALSGRHTVGKDVDNKSVISGRHETDNSNLNVDGKPIGNSPIGRHDSGDTSIHNIDGQPSGKSPIGRHDGPDTSNFNIDGTPSGNSPSGRHDSGDTSIHNIDGTPNGNSPSGRHDSGDTSIHNIDGVPNSTNPGGRHESDNSILNIDGSPSGNSPSGRHEVDTSNLNVDGVVPSTNPKGRHEASPTEVTDVNYFNDIHAVGFTSNFQPGTPSKYNIGSSQLQTPISGPSAIDFIGNAAASGFTIKQDKTSFAGIDDNTYTLPNSIAGGRLWNIGKSKLEAQLGEGTFVPGAGMMVGHDVKLFVSAAGFSAGRRYSSVVGKNKVSALGYQYVQKNSPSFLDAEYNKFKVRDEAHNPSYIKHPLILRGIQQDGGIDPQRWGFGIGGFDDGLVRGGTATALDRSIIDTARIAKWMASPRGLMWIVKQVGLGLTNAKVETNPLTPGPFGRQTRIHTGLASLLSVPGTAFGLHFTRHGIPFVNEIASYEAVQITKAIAQDGFGDTGLKRGPSNNRLVNLHYASDLLTGGLGKGLPIVSLSGLAGPQSVYGIGATTIRRYVNTNDAINDLAKKVILDDEFQGLLTYDITTQYAGGVSNSKYKSLNPFSTRKYTAKDIDLGGLYGFLNNPNSLTSGIKDKYPVTEKPINPESNPTATPVNRDISGNVVTGIKAYSTLAYGQLKRGDEIGVSIIPNDFRNNLDQNFNGTGRSDIAGDALNKRGDLTYDKKSREWHFGMGEQGAVDSPGRPIIRADYTATSRRADGTYNKGNAYEGKIAPFRGDLVNLFDAGQYATDTLYDNVGAKDFVPLFFTGPRLSRGGNKEETLVFRATVGNISDNFSPNWNSTQILGRADAVHTYNSWGRQFSFDFRVQSTSRDEMRPLWRKLNYLASWTAPRYTSGLMRGPYMRITLGNLFQETPCFINSLTYSTDDNTTWEINLEDDEQMLQLPHGVNVSLSLTMLMDYRPQWGGRMYSMSDRGRANDRSQKVNWLYDSSIEGNKGLIGTVGTNEPATEDTENSNVNP